MPPTFPSHLRYTDRESKLRYVWEKYRPILEGRSILDVGADECHLRDHLDEGATYLGIGLGGHPDREVDLEAGPLPFEDRSFDTVLCLDVLEHLEKIHFVFDECCRVSRRHVVISLPNGLNGVWHLIARHRGEAKPALKYYGLPLDRPDDRHRWFFSFTEAKRFIAERGERNGLKVLHADAHPHGGRKPRNPLRRLAEWYLLRRDLNPIDLHASTIWVVLERPSSP